MTDTGQIPGEGQPENSGGQPDGQQPGFPVNGSYPYAGQADAFGDAQVPGVAAMDPELLLPGSHGAWNDPHAAAAAQAHPQVAVQQDMYGGQDPYAQQAAYGQHDPYAQHGPYAEYDPYAQHNGYAPAEGYGGQPQVQEQQPTPQEQSAPSPEQPVHVPEPHETDGRDSGAIDIGAVRAANPERQETPAKGTKRVQNPPRRPLHLGPPVPEQSGAVRPLSDRGLGGRARGAAQKGTGSAGTAPETPAQAQPGPQPQAEPHPQPESALPQPESAQAQPAPQQEAAWTESAPQPQQQQQTGLPTPEQQAQQASQQGEFAAQYGSPAQAEAGATPGGPAYGDYSQADPDSLPGPQLGALPPENGAWAAQPAQQSVEAEVPAQAHADAAYADAALADPALAEGRPEAQQPVAQEPVAQQPIAQQPVAQEPVAQENSPMPAAVPEQGDAVTDAATPSVVSAIPRTPSVPGAQSAVPEAQFAAAEAPSGAAEAVQAAGAEAAPAVVAEAPSDVAQAPSDVAQAPSGDADGAAQQPEGTAAPGPEQGPAAAALAEQAPTEQAPAEQAPPARPGGGRKRRGRRAKNDSSNETTGTGNTWVSSPGSTAVEAFEPSRQATATATAPAAEGDGIAASVPEGAPDTQGAASAADGPKIPAQQAGELPAESAPAQDASPEPVQNGTGNAEAAAGPVAGIPAQQARHAQAPAGQGQQEHQNQQENPEQQQEPQVQNEAVSGVTGDEVTGRTVAQENGTGGPGTAETGGEAEESAPGTGELSTSESGTTESGTTETATGESAAGESAPEEAVAAAAPQQTQPEAEQASDAGPEPEADAAVPQQGRHSAAREPAPEAEAEAEAGPQTPAVEDSQGQAPAPAPAPEAPPADAIPADGSADSATVPQPAAHASEDGPQAAAAASAGGETPGGAVDAPQPSPVPDVQAAAPGPGQEPGLEPGQEAGQESGTKTAQETTADAAADAAADPAEQPEPAQETEPPAEEARVPAGPPAPGYADDEREAVHRLMRERRDIRNGFRPDPIPHEVLLRVLEAAHTAPSVGHSQPWDFVVIRSEETRRAMHELAERQRHAYAQSLPKGRAKQFKELKIEAILETPVNIVVTADPTRGGRHTLGRHTQPQMAPYSSALAVENLWLAARAEGLGVGWVSFFDEREMVRALELPEHLEVVAYLCVGYVDEFPPEPELAQAGWSKRRPLSWVVHEESYGRRVLPGSEPQDLLSDTVAAIRPLDAKALGEAWERQKRMTKPAGALGMLEIISAQLCGLSRKCPPPLPEPAAVAVFAGDHGVHAQGVTPWPQEVTGQMVANFLGGGAVCNAFANQVGAEVCVVDVGVACELPSTPGLLPRKVRAGTADMTQGPAMTREEALRAVEVGIETARDLVAAGNRALLTGEMGIANTTASAVLVSACTGADPSEVTGRGTGINDETHARKVEVVRRALEVHQPDPEDPLGMLAAVGGLEHAALVGLILGGASLRTPVILDGVSAGAAALVARCVAPEALAACIAGHRSAEPGHVAALTKLGLRPLIDLDLRLGEGTGALLSLPMVQSAARAMHEVATFDSAGVTGKS